MDIKLFLYKCWCKFLKWFGDIYLASKPPLVDAMDIRAILRLAKTGDVLLRRYKGYLDGRFIPGRYSHSCIVVDKDHIVHAIAENVERIDILDFCLHTDGFCLLRPRYKHCEDPNSVAQKALNCIGKGYDFSFDSQNTSTLYCHELTNLSLSAAEENTIPKQRKMFGIIKKNVIIADDFYHKFVIVYEAQRAKRKKTAKNLQ